MPPPNVMPSDVMSMFESWLRFDIHCFQKKRPNYRKRLVEVGLLPLNLLTAASNFAEVMSHMDFKSVKEHKVKKSLKHNSSS